ncbi:MAG: right-handed parallel beta-helix repeat-containing protein, partial [Acidobacteria bacterium]|nr:right-handed parallel beta-helix repeat-containing protein [Acidobacteriota bacterium]
MKSSHYGVRLVLMLMCGLFVFCLHESAARAGTLTVNTATDTAQNVCDGTLSLREAMLLSSGVNTLGRSLTAGEQAMVTGAVTWSGTVPPPLGCSSSLGPYRFITSGVGGDVRDEIFFATNVDTVLLTAGLPEITWGLDSIDGLKSNGTKVTINGANAGANAGFSITASLDVTIRNLIIQNFQREGIFVSGSDNCVFEGSEIFSNASDGINIVPFTDVFGTHNSRNNRIGGTSLSQRNVIHLNGRNGITITADPNADRATDQGNVIENNFVGIRSNGTQDSGNGRQGIRLQNAFGNRIGGDTAASRNVISGNDDNGILLDGDGCYSNRILNNFIGTNKDGNALVGNSGSGVALLQGAGDPVGPSSSPNIIGDVGKGNVIGGNFFGVGMFDANTDHNIVRGNFIGTDLAASLNLGNVRDAVFIQSAHDNQIGGTGAGEANVFAYNGGAGVYVQAGTANNIRRNRIFLNTDLGIDLHPGGVTPNDFMDGDTGPNNFQNFPVITSGSSAGGNTTVRGSINSTPNTALTLEFFVSPQGDPSGNGEGSTYIGSVALTTDSGGNAVFNNTFATGISYQGFYATMTATDPNGNTSEFSQTFRLGCTYSLSFNSQSFPVTGGNGSFNLNTTSTCDWQAVQSDSWITINGNAGGTG